MSTRPAIVLHGLTKTFRGRRSRGAGVRARCADLLFPQTEQVLAVDHVSFQIEAGERVAFIGPNGAGKSTTLKMLAGILYPDTGSAEVSGLVPWRERARLGFLIGTVFGQRSQLWYHLPPRDTFALLARVYELTHAEYRARLEALVAAFDLAPLLERPVRQLSLGQRMRCELAASLLHKPRILFLDEPTIGLDVSAKATLRDLLLRQSEKDGATLLLTSHDTGDIERVCHRVIVIHRGIVLLDGSIASLKRRFLRTRRITFVTSAEHLDLAKLHGARLVTASLHRTTLEVDAAASALGALVDAVTKQTLLHDITIEDPPLDDVIRALYAEADTEKVS